MTLEDTSASKQSFEEQVAEVMKSVRERAELENKIRTCFFKKKPKKNGIRPDHRYADIRFIEERKRRVDNAVEDGAPIRFGFRQKTFRETDENKEILGEYLLAPFQGEKVLSDQRALHLYFDEHNHTYRQYLDERISRKPDIISQKTKLVVAIAARNEMELPQAVEAIRKDWEQAHGEMSFFNDVSIVIFNNTPVNGKNVAAEQVLQVLATSPNVLVFSEEIDNLGTNAGIPKKIAADIALRLCFKKHVYPPIIAVDADLKGLSPGTIDRSLQLLDQSGCLAVSPDYDYDMASQEKYPLWRLRCALLKRIREYDVVLNPIRSPRIIGGFYATKPKTLALMGGVPAIKNQDLEMTTRLRDLFSIRWLSLDPISRPDSSTSTAYFSPSKELENILLGRSAESHWNDAEIQAAMSGKERLDWQELPEQDQPLLKPTVTPEGIVTVLNDSWSFLVATASDRVGKNIMLQLLSSRFLRSLIDLNVDLTRVEIHTSSGEVLKSTAEISAFLERNDSSEQGEFGPTFSQLVRKSFETKPTGTEPTSWWSLSTIRLTT